MSPPCGDTGHAGNNGFLQEPSPVCRYGNRKCFSFVLFPAYPTAEIGRRYGRSRSAAATIRKALRQLQAEMEGNGA